jgi:murein DD-endopeptidase MepM/ murein hydrolase activator NlpD
LQQFDHDSGPSFKDYACGSRSYNTHKGVDIGLAIDSEIHRNVPMLAVAAGRVVRLRDGETEGIAFTQGVDAVPKGRECGNGFILEYGCGWEPIYAIWPVG